jgi:hypothetical protein
MKTTYKFILLFILILLYIIILTILLADSFKIQSTVCIAVLILSFIRFGTKKLIAEIKLIVPFVIAMLVVYMLLGIVGFRFSSQASPNSTFGFWLIYGMNKSIIFINSILFLQIVLSFIQTNDILNLPLKIDTKKYFILGRALLIHATDNLDNLQFYLKLMPEYQVSKLSLKQWFFLKLKLTHGIISMLMRESRIKGELIDNRIKHCFKAKEILN